MFFWFPKYLPFTFLPGCPVCNQARNQGVITTSCQFKVLNMFLNCSLFFIPKERHIRLPIIWFFLVYILGLTHFCLLNYLEFSEWTKMILVLLYLLFLLPQMPPTLNLSDKPVLILSLHLYISFGKSSLCPSCQLPSLRVTCIFTIGL